jgi:hypothetical protein
MAVAHHFFVVDDQDAGFVVHVPPRKLVSTVYMQVACQFEKE